VKYYFVHVNGIRKCTQHNLDKQGINHGLVQKIIVGPDRWDRPDS